MQGLVHAAAALKDEGHGNCEASSLSDLICQATMAVLTGATEEDDAAEEMVAHLLAALGIDQPSLGLLQLLLVAVDLPAVCLVCSAPRQ